MRLITLISLVFMFPFQSYSEVYYIYGKSGNIYPIQIKGATPTQSELQRIQKYLEGFGDTLPYKVPSFDPIECPWQGRPLRCKEYDLTIFDKCIENKYPKLRGLTDDASVTAKISIDRKCYKKASEPSIFDKLFN